uniref:Uncharacterized protein n=1 Tax=Rhizophora mucronata TaxID=61149 RepID=A0A2P2PID7_RHIMU
MFLHLIAFDQVSMLLDSLTKRWSFLAIFFIFLPKVGVEDVKTFSSCISTHCS